MYPWGPQPPPPAPLRGGPPPEGPPVHAWPPIQPPMQPSFPPQQLQHAPLGPLHHPMGHYQGMGPAGGGFQHNTQSWGHGQGLPFNHPIGQQPPVQQYPVPHARPLPQNAPPHPGNQQPSPPAAWTPMTRDPSLWQGPPAGGVPPPLPHLPAAPNAPQFLPQHQQQQGFQEHAVPLVSCPPPLPPPKLMLPPISTQPGFALGPPPVVRPPARPPPPAPAEPLPPPLPQEPSAESMAPPLPPSVTDAADLFLVPGRSLRPARFAVVLRGIPGSGKSWAARKLRDIEVSQGGTPPGISSLDTYFMQEIEKVEVDERGRKRKVISEQYEYEHEMEETYAEDLVRSFRRITDERRFSIVIVDAPNLSAASLAKFWQVGQKGGYEVYVAEPLETDPVVCAKRNTHHRQYAEVEAAAKQLEPAPSTFMHLDLKPLLLGKRDPFKAIREVEMEESDSEPTGNEDGVATSQPVKRRRFQENLTPKQRSRWEDADEDRHTVKSGRQARSALRRDYQIGKQGKRVKWADEVEESQGFSIGGAAKQQLEQVFVIEGLGPAREDGIKPEPQAATLRTFLFGVHHITNIDLPMKR